MNVIKLLEVCMYYGLLIAGVYFVWGSILDYYRGDISYSETKEAITLNDLPTMSFCLGFSPKLRPLTYGKDLTIHYKVLQEDNQTLALSLDQSVVSDIGLEIHLTELILSSEMEQETKKGSMTMPMPQQRQCYSVTTKWNNRAFIDPKEFAAQCLLSFNESVIVKKQRGPIKRINPYFEYLSQFLSITSEENSFGLTTGQWFDGNVTLDPWGSIPHFIYGRLIRIEEIVEYHNRVETCSSKSYYECLGRRISEYQKEKEIIFEGRNVSFTEICFPYTLPSIERIPVCSNGSHRAYFEAVIKELETDQQKHCKRSCHVKEFHYSMDTPFNSKKSRPLTTVPLFAYKLSLEQHLKTVRKEYFVMSLSSLVGNVGGTLGMFIGFSLIDTLQSSRLWNWLLLMVSSLFKNENRPRYFKGALSILLNLILSICAMHYLRDSFCIFLGGKTGLSVSTEPITLTDLPTTTICFGLGQRLPGMATPRLWKALPNWLEYGEDFFIYVKVVDNEEETVKLVSGDIEMTNGIVLSLSHHMTSFNGTQCSIIDIKSTGKKYIDMENFHLEFRVIFVKTIDVIEPHVFHYMNGTDDHGPGWWDSSKLLWIEEPLYISVPDIPHQIAASIKVSSRENALRQLEGFGQVQSIFIIPSTFNNIICYGSNDKSCHQWNEYSYFGKMTIIGIVQVTEHHKIHPKWINTVRAESNKTSVQRKFQVIEQQDPLTHLESNVFGFKYRFISPKASRESRKSKQPIKLVSREYMLKTGSALAGDIGGTLGMFVGFSFISVLEWMFQAALTLFKNTYGTIKNRARMNYGTLIIMKRMAQFLFYTGLLIGALTFSQGCYESYMSGLTAYSVSKQYLHQNDTPSLSICFVSAKGKKNMEYGFDFSITWIFNGIGAISLVKDEYVGLKNLQLHLSELVQSMKTEQVLKDTHDVFLPRGRRQQCFKLTTKWNGNDSLNFLRFRSNVMFTFRQNYTSIPSYAKIFITSEKNAYGLVGTRWFDGHPSSKDFSLRGLSGRFGFASSLRIHRIDEYKTLDSLCSTKSYYECLAERFLSFDFSKISNLKVNESTCDFKVLCYPFSLPTEHIEVPLCNNDIDRACYEEIILKLEEDQDKHCKKSCQILEFKIKQDSTIKKYEPNTFGFDYRFVLPKATMDVRSKIPFKFVHKEYLITPAKSLLGNVGGNLGMFFGVSFIGLFDWIWSAIANKIPKLKSRISTMTSEKA